MVRRCHNYDVSLPWVRLLQSLPCLLGCQVVLLALVLPACLEVHGPHVCHEDPLYLEDQWLQALQLDPGRNRSNHALGTGMFHENKIVTTVIHTHRWAWWTDSSCRSREASGALRAENHTFSYLWRIIIVFFISYYSNTSCVYPCRFFTHHMI